MARGPRWHVPTPPASQSPGPASSYSSPSPLGVGRDNNTWGTQGADQGARGQDEGAQGPDQGVRGQSQMAWGTDLRALGQSQAAGLPLPQASSPVVLAEVEAGRWVDLDATQRSLKVALAAVSSERAALDAALAASRQHTAETAETGSRAGAMPRTAPQATTHPSPAPTAQQVAEGGAEEGAKGGQGGLGTPASPPPQAAAIAQLRHRRQQQWQAGRSPSPSPTPEEVEGRQAKRTRCLGEGGRRVLGGKSLEGQRVRVCGGS